MKDLELVNRNAETTYEAYGMNKEEFYSFIEEKFNSCKERFKTPDQLFEHLSGDITRAEAVMLYRILLEAVTNKLPFPPTQILVDTLSMTAKVDIKNTMDTIETLYIIDGATRIQYITSFMSSIDDFKPERILKGD